MGRRKRRVAAKEPEQGVKAAQASLMRSEALRRRRQKVIVTWSLVGAGLLLVALLLYTLIPKPSPYTAFAQCLSAGGAVLYGTDWCSHCQSQKRLFGSAFKQVAWTNCDYSRTCEEKGITGYPTWILGDGTRLEGEQPLELLAAKTGCALPT